MNVAMACMWEATARKVGNVHPNASFADMEYFDFVKSALALEEAWRNICAITPLEAMSVPVVSLGIPEVCEVDDGRIASPSHDHSQTSAFARSSPEGTQPLAGGRRPPVAVRRKPDPGRGRSGLEFQELRPLPGSGDYRIHPGVIAPLDPRLMAASPAGDENHALSANRKIGKGVALEGEVASRRDAGGGEIKLGERIFQGVEATQAAVGKNTNLGIVLLLAPLLDRRESNLNETTVEDARQLYSAIRLASPGGMGKSEDQDVAAEPTVTLLEAMTLAADRDMIARQYANGFAYILDFGVPAFLNGIERFGCIEAAIVHCQFRWLTAFPDSLIARKNGIEVAEDVRQRAAAVFELGIHTTEGRAAGVALDRHLRSIGHALNPGTTADLVTACLFVALREGKVDNTLPFRWNVPDWL